MKKTSLHKNRFSVQATRLQDIAPRRKLGRKFRHARADPTRDRADLRAMMMAQWDDSGIAELLAETVGKPLSPEARAFIDHIDAVMEGRASIGDPLNPVTSEAA